MNGSVYVLITVDEGSFNHHQHKTFLLRTPETMHSRCIMSLLQHVQSAHTNRENYSQRHTITLVHTSASEHGIYCSSSSHTGTINTVWQVTGFHISSKVRDSLSVTHHWVAQEAEEGHEESKSLLHSQGVLVGDGLWPPSQACFHLKSLLPQLKRVKLVLDIFTLSQWLYHIDSVCERVAIIESCSVWWSVCWSECV